LPDKELPDKELCPDRMESRYTFRFSVIIRGMLNDYKYAWKGYSIL
jgi:hypothetical protein